MSDDKYLSITSGNPLTPQGGSGIRMPDRTPVGWLPLEARKKKLDFIKFLLAEPFLNTNISFYTT